MKYPMLSKWVVFKKYNEDMYSAYNYLNDDECAVGKEIVDFAVKLDGKTDPYKAAEGYTHDKVDYMLTYLKCLDLIRESRITIEKIGTAYLSLAFPRVTGGRKILCFFLNLLLLVSWLPILIFGIAAFKNADPYCSDKYDVLAWIGGIAFGAVCHEIAHAVAIAGSGGRLFEIGAMVRFFIPGAYVSGDFKRVKSRFLRIQIHAAGIETNFLIGGLSLLLATITGADLSGLLRGVAMNNILLGAINLAFASGLDGSHILGELFGDVDYVDRLGCIMHSRTEREALRKQGINGHATIAASFVVGILKLVIPAVLILSAMEVLLCVMLML